jgi:glycerol-3-phosphate dehydrogenase
MLIAPILGWDAEAKKSSISEFTKQLKNERSSLAKLLARTR